MSKKITELSKLSSAANTDILLIVEDPSTTPTNKYVEIGDLIYTVAVKDYVKGGKTCFQNATHHALAL